MILKEFIQRLRANFETHQDSRERFLRFFQRLTLLLSVAYLVTFAFTQSWFGFSAVALYLGVLLRSFVWIKQGESFKSSLWLAILFNLVPLICVLFSGGVESPYIAWLVTPIFAAAALLGAQAAVVTTAAVILLSMLIFLNQPHLAVINELNADYFEILVLLSHGSAAALLGYFAWKNVVDLETESRLVRKRSAALERALSEKAVALDRLEDTQQKRSQLLGMVAHELRTPVSAISMLVSEDVEGQTWEKARVPIARSAEDLLNTIDDMRLIINPDLIRPIRKATFNLSELNSSIETNVASLISSTGVNFALKVSQSLSAADRDYISDAYRIRTAVSNLIKNACLHSRGTEVTLYCDVYRTKTGVEYLQWTVSDNGCGIAIDEIDRLFRVGERGDSEAEGTGFGLPISRGWIEEIAGEVVYQPRASGGSLFMVRVPLITDADNQSSQETLQGFPEAVESQVAKLNVLVVEDDHLLRRLAAALFSDFVASVDIAENGRVALHKLNDTHDLVLTDYFMPEVSGAQLASTLRSQGYTGPIVALTAATLGDQRDELLESGVDIVLPKPLTKASFKRAVQRLMERGYFADSIDQPLAD